MTPEQIVDLVDFRYLTDAITPDEALEILRARGAGPKAARIAALDREGYPAYTTSPGWLGYSDEKLVRLAEQAVADGFRTIKLKVGADLSDDQASAHAGQGGGRARRRDRRRRQPALGRRRGDRLDAATRPRRHPAWIEEPTFPDDILGHAAIRPGIAPDPGVHR